MSKIARDNRNRDIRLIQIARRELGLSDADYYTIIAAQGNGATSSTDLDAAGRARVLDHMRRLGWKPRATAKTTRRPRRPEPAADRLPLVKRIRAQLISLDRKPDEYADGIVKQMLGAEAPEFYEWCEPRVLHKVSQALGVEQQRRGAATS